MDSLTGTFLVASPHLTDSNFVKTAVLMLRHEEAGSLGVVVNRPGDKTVRQVWEMIEAAPCDNDQAVFQGGPVPGPLIAVHNASQLAEQEILPGLYMTMQRAAVDKLVRLSEPQFRLFSGNAGWAGGQLEGEIKVGGWLRCPATIRDVFSDPDDLWDRLAARIGLAIAAPQIDASQIPKDPRVN